MASKVVDGTSAAAPDGQAAGTRGPLPVQALASYPGLMLPLLLIAAALAVTVFASVQLWRMEARPLRDPVADMPRLYAQAAVEALRLNEAAEHHAEDPAGRQEFIRRYHLLLRRLDQLEPVLRDRTAAAAAADDGIAAALVQLRDRDPAVVAYSPRDLGGLAARLTQLERALSRAGARVQDAHQAQQAERAARLYRILVLGAAAVLAGLLGLAWLVSCLLWTLRRVQDDRKLQQDLQRACDSAAYLRNIAAVIAHQMRAPLTVIDSAAQRMLSRPDLGQRPQDGAALLRIRRQVAQVLHFMDQAMLAGAVEGGTPLLHPRPVPLQDLTAMVLAHEGLGEGRQRLVLPDGPAGLRILCDPGLAFHALANLVENALKYSPAGSPVELRAAEAGGMAVISVIDRGAGVPLADQEAIFQRFWRGARAAGQPGSGVGLWLARRLAEIQGGTIRVASDGQSGARFDLVLPAAGAGTGAARVSPGPPPSPVGAEVRRGRP